MSFKSLNDILETENFHLACNVTLSGSFKSHYTVLLKIKEMFYLNIFP